MTHLQSNSLSLEPYVLCCEYQLKRSQKGRSHSWADISSWAQNLGRTPGQVYEFLSQHAATGNLLQRITCRKHSIHIEISGLTLLITPQLLEALAKDAADKQHAACTITAGAVLYGMGHTTRIELIDKPLRVTLNEQGWNDFTRAGITHTVLDLVGVLSPTERTQEFEPWQMWEPHDYTMYRRSRFDTATGGYGATRHRRPDATLCDHLQAIATVPFPAPYRMHPLTLEQALRRRTSKRNPTESHLCLEKLTALLEESLCESEAGPGQGTRLPFPCGGAIHELRLFVLAQHVPGLEAGLWYVDLNNRRYQCVARADDQTHRGPYNRLIRTYASSARQDTKAVQALILVAADFGLVTSTYEAVAYSLTLKHVGAWMQTACLIAEAIPVNTCPLGGGDAHAFESMTGISSDRLVPVGELLIST